MKRITLQPAYVLHRRSYRETSFLVELITPEYGRLTVLAKGVRKTRSTTQGLLQPFIPLLVSWAGKAELMNLSHVEANGILKNLHGECLFAGLYLNELLMCLLQKWDSHPGLFVAYKKTIEALQASKLEQKVLRSFEKYLLEELGYGLLPKSDITLQQTFSSDKFYRFTPELGFVLSESTIQNGNLFSGKSLLAIAKENWQETNSLLDAKRLNRLVLAPLLGARPIHSRKLFMQLDSGNQYEEE